MGPRLVPLMLLATLTSGLLAGCVAFDAPLRSPDEDVAPGIPASTRAVPHDLGDLTLELTHLNPAEAGPARVRATVTAGSAPANDTALELVWRFDGTTTPRTLMLAANATRGTIEERLAAPPGPYTVEAWIGNTSARLDIDLLATVTLRLNASETYASDQNVFHVTHIVAFAPWKNDSAHDVLQEGARRHGIPLRTTYDEGLESYFIDMINDTAFRWDVEAAGISRNWMILVDGTASPHATDDTFPDPDQLLEYRYVRCYATGRCDDL